MRDKLIKDEKQCMLNILEDLRISSNKGTYCPIGINDIYHQTLLKNITNC